MRGGTRFLFQTQALGFAYLVIEGRTLTIEMWSAAGERLFSHRIEK